LFACKTQFVITYDIKLNNNQSEQATYVFSLFSFVAKYWAKQELNPPNNPPLFFHQVRCIGSQGGRLTEHRSEQESYLTMGPDMQEIDEMITLLRKTFQILDAGKLSKSWMKEH